MRVLSIPSGHVYPRTIRPNNTEFLPDPDIDGNWWPHPALEAEWWTEANAAGIDVVHIHFGFEHRSPAQIVQLVTAIRQHGVALVVTVHDIDNPHLLDPADQEEHHQRMRILVRAANAAITLTEQARNLLHQRAGHDIAVKVVPHPLVVTRAQRARIHAEPARPAVFVKSLRPNVIADPAFYVALAQAETVVYLHDEPGTRQLHEALVDSGVDVIAHEPMDDQTLYSAVANCSAVVLPYVRGTHSGWLEKCRDLGVGVAVPDIGCFADQADDPGAVADLIKQAWG